MRKAIILSSGGVDSTTCLSVAVHELGAENVSTASIFLWTKACEGTGSGKKSGGLLPRQPLRI